MGGSLLGSLLGGLLGSAGGGVLPTTVALQQSATQNQIGSIQTYSGQLPQWVQSSSAVPAGQAYMLPSGTVFINHRDTSSDQIEEIKRQWLEQKRDQFLKHPVTHREAFLNDLRAKAVANDMNGPGLFGVNRSGYAAWMSGSSGIPTPIPIEITLEQYESWHADGLVDETLNDQPQS